MRVRYASLHPMTTVIVGLLALIAIPLSLVAFTPKAHAEPLQSPALTENADTPFPDEETIQTTLNEYLIINPDGSQRFDIDRAEENNVDSRIVEIGDQANYLMADQETTESDRQLRDLNPTNCDKLEASILDGLELTLKPLS